MKDRAHDDAMAEILRNDTAYAVELLNCILEDGNQDELLIALRQLVKTYAGELKVAEHPPPYNMHIKRILSVNGNLDIRSLSAILKTMGLRLAVQPYH